MKLLKGILSWALIFLFLAPAAWGQTGTSTIRGTVVDPQGLVVSAASVTLTNLATHAVRTTQSTGTGAYVFDLVPPADYRLEVEAKGFKKTVVSDVHASIGKPTEVTVKLAVGTASEVVEVRAASQEVLINTQDATLGNNFISLQITQLPLEARNLVDLLSLQPGSTREGYVTGARADQSNVTLDGVDINNAQTGNAAIPLSTNSLVIGQLDTDRGNITSGPVLRLNAEAIEEFRVTTANGNANQGRSSGSQINLVTKSGTNGWHGAAFEFYRSRGFTANDWFNNHATPIVPRTPLIRHTFGGAVGGPIIKNKAFFFYSFESRHDSSAQSVTRVVPLGNVFGDGSLGSGVIHYTYCADPPACTSTPVASLNLAQNQAAFPQTGINQAALDALAAAEAKYPANDSTQGDGLNTSGFRFNAPTPVRLNSHVAKLDFNLTSKQALFARLNVVYDHQALPRWLPDTTSPQVWSHPWGLAVGHTWTISNHWVNNFRYGFTRQAFSSGGDSTGNDISFRFVFQPNGQQHTLTRVTPVHNFTDDVSWIHGKHTIQFGGNVRLIRNSRVSFANAFDNAITNPSFYLKAGAGVSQAFQNYIDANNLLGAGGNVVSIAEVQAAATAIIGRFSQYTANFTFGKDGTLLSPGSPAIRSFATQAYDTYIQDTWKLRPNLTLTLGLRYSLERPVYETQGFEVQPTVPLGTYFAERLAAANSGENLTDLITINRSGPVNGGKPLYNWDKNNFQPRIAVAWSPEGGDGFFGRLLGRGRKSVIRGGFAMTNDYYGQALAVDWDLNNTLGFTSNYTTPANTYDITTANRPLAPLFTGFNQDVQSLPNVVVPANLQFPLTAIPLDPANGQFGERIEQSVDSKLHAPTEYVWNVTFERELPKGMLLSVSYVGRLGRSLLARRDVAAFNDLRDPKTGMDWYAAGTEMEKLRQKGTDISQIPALLSPTANQFFNDMFPANLTVIAENFEGTGFDPTFTNAQVFYAYNTPGPTQFFSGNDWTDAQAEIDLALAFGGFSPRFMQPQYGALSAWSTIGNSRYDALVVSLRQRLSSLTLDFNYTYSRSLDDASGLQTAGGFDTSPFIDNPIRQHDWYAYSDFDVRHNINANGVWQLPFGKGKRFLSDAGKGADAIVGGWQLSGIFRWNTGIPQFSPFDDQRWATNWDVQVNVTPTSPLHTCPDRPVNGTPKLFGSACGDINKIYQSFRNAYPGESGPRNIFRLPGYTSTDLGISKTFRMPWNENHHLQLRWDAFNVFNQQHFGAVDGSRTGFGVGLDPKLTGLTAPSNWSNFIQIQGQPRVMQIGVRYSF